MSTSIKIGNPPTRGGTPNVSWRLASREFRGKTVGKQNFNYCNESFWRAGESVAFVWSQQELILAGSRAAIHHERNNAACGGEHDKRHESRASGGFRMDLVPEQSRK